MCANIGEGLGELEVGQVPDGCADVCQQGDYGRGHQREKQEDVRSMPDAEPLRTDVGNRRRNFGIRI